MKLVQYLSPIVALLISGCTHAAPQTHFLAEATGPDGKLVRLIERRQVYRETSLLTPEGPKWNRQTASVSRYYILSDRKESELPFLEANDEYRPSIWGARGGLWLAHVIPISGETHLVLFDSAGNILDRRVVHLPRVDPAEGLPALMRAKIRLSLSRTHIFTVSRFEPGALICSKNRY
jgi:hypothetical protein